MAGPSVEELTLSLVREFLSRKGLKVTLASMDQEFPRTEDSISNRAALARAVGVERLMKKNKEQVQPYRTILEVIIKSLVSKSTTTASHDKLLTSHDQSLHPKQHSPQPHRNYPELSLHSEHRHTGTDVTPAHIGGHTHHAQHGKPITSSSHTSTSSHTPSPHSVHTGTSQGILSAGKSETPGRLLANSLGMLSTEDSVSVNKQNPATTNAKKNPAVRSITGSGAIQAGLKTTKKLKPRSFTPIESQDDPAEKELVITEGSSLGEPLSLAASRRPALSSKPHQKKGDRVFGNVGNLDGNLKFESKSKKPTADVGHQSTQPTPRPGAAADVLLFEDLEDEQLDVGGGLPMETTNQMPAFPQGQPITVETCKALRQLLFGSSKGPSFSPEWRRQNFVFSDVPGLQYGLVQHKGGPCGVLAAIQAFLLKHIMFTGSQKTLTHGPCPSPDERRKGLVKALADILWKSGGGKRAVVALLSSISFRPSKATSSYQPDHVTERMMLHEFTNRDAMECFIRANLPLFEDASSSGCIQFLLSVLLSKGVDKIRSEMDEKNGCLIGAHGYCTQELVNLLLTGAAVSNVFDGEVELSGQQGGEKLVLRGLPERSEIGLLSLFEHYQSCQVGNHYKDPIYPVWVIYSESHFSTLFSTQKALLNINRAKFDLYYYDGLANQDEEIRLTVTLDSQKKGPGLTDDTLTPPLELCICTKWLSATVDWNGTEPIL